MAWRAQRRHLGLPAGFRRRLRHPGARRPSLFEPDESGRGTGRGRAVVVQELGVGEPGAVTAFVERALDFFAEQGIESKRLMTDNAWSYTKNRSLRELLERRGIRHLRTKPRTPRTNG